MEEQTSAQARLENGRKRRLEEKRKRRLRGRVLLLVLLTIAVLSLILILRGCGSRQEPEQPQENAHIAAERPALDTEPDTVITIAAVGDIQLSEAQLEDALQEGGGFQFAPNFAAVSGYTSAADFTLGDLELNFCGAPYSGKPDYRAPDALAETLRSIGFDLLQTANTCSIQNGISGLKSTIRCLEQAGIDHAGTYASAEEKAANAGVLLRNINGVQVAFLAYTKGLNSLSLPEGSEYAVDLLYQDYSTDYSKVDTAALTASLDAAKALKPDVIIALLHWGAEYDNSVSSTQEKIRKLLLEGGVDAIIGTHSHMVSTMETREVTTTDGEKKTCFVAYSLGNFYSDSTRAHTRESVILNLQFTKNGETGDTALSGVSYIPIYTVDNGEEAEQRFEVLPIRSAISSGLFPEQTERFTQAIADLRSATDSDYDSGR